MGTVVAVGALCVAIYALKKQSKEQQSATRRNLIGTRIDSLIKHARAFYEDEYYRQSRYSAYACMQYALGVNDGGGRSPQFRLKLARFNHVCADALTDPIVGWYKPSDDFAHGKPETSVRSWNIAAHQLDDIISFFAALAEEIRSIQELISEEPANSMWAEEEDGRFRGIVNRMNLYWDWWGPIVNYVASVSDKFYEENKGAIPVGCNPDWKASFKLLDEYFIPRRDGRIITSEVQIGDDLLPRANSEMGGNKVLYLLQRAPVRWKHCEVNGSECETKI